jgi:hypothetical protein
MDSVEVIEHEFKAGELASIDAIERLQNLGFSPLEAESKVEGWDEGPDRYLNK